MAAAISCMRALPGSWARIQPLAQMPYATAARAQTRARMRGDVSAEPAAIGFSLGGVARWGDNASVVAPLRCFLLPCHAQGRLAHRSNLQPNRRLPAGGRRDRA